MDQYTPGMKSPNEDFYRILIEDLSRHMASPIPEDQLSTTFWVPVVEITPEAQEHIAQLKLEAEREGKPFNEIYLRPVLLMSSTDFYQYTRMLGVEITRGNNTPFVLGSRKQYDNILAFDDEESANRIATGRGNAIEVSLSTLLQVCVAKDIGLIFMPDQSTIIVEPDRVNEYLRFSTPSYDRTDAKLGNEILSHNLRPEEFVQMSALIAEYYQFMKAPLFILYGQKADGVFCNVIKLYPRGDLSQDDLKLLAKEIANRAVEIKTPVALNLSSELPPQIAEMCGGLTL